MNKILEYLKADYNRCKEAVMLLSNGKCPMWIFVIYYFSVAPFGLLLLPILALIHKIIIWNLDREIKEILKKEA